MRDLFELAETGKFSLNIGNNWRKCKEEYKAYSKL